jgi:general secretion pathway protein D|tara:strand:+ start:89397 stop:91328 length:1932 start_codon:yes stop_codon:yes gene_type:complete
MNKTSHYLGKGRPVIPKLVVIIISLVLVAEIQAQSVLINFRDADIRTVIESVAEITGKSFVLDPRVRGTITIVSPEPIAEELLYEAILSALQVQGFQAIDDGAIVRVVPFTTAFNTPTDFVGSELATRVFALDYAKASELVAVVKPIMSKGGLMQAFAAGNNLLVTDTVSQLDRLDSLLDELDTPDQSAVEVIYLQHISAGEAIHIADQMQSLEQLNLSIVEDSFNNRVIVGGSRIGRLSFRQMLEALDVPSTRGGGIEVIYLNYSDALAVKTMLDSMLQSQTFLRLAGEVATEGATSNYRVEVDEDNNALVIAASAPVVAEIQNLVRKIDRPRLQVLIEAVIAEVTEDQARQLSAQLLYASSGAGGYISRFDDLILSLVGSGLDGAIDETEATGAASLIPNGGIGVVGSFDQDNGEGFGALIQALKSDSETRILSTPSVVTLDNEEATLSVGNEVPFITGSTTTTGNGTANPFTTIERQEVGVMLRVVPQINEGSAVRLEIEQESSNLLAQAQAEFGTEDVITSKRTISTNVMVGNGEVLILGGLINESSTDTESRVPILGDIPFLGRLFRSTSNTGDQSVLMMFIRPTILENSFDANEVTQRQFDYLRTHESEYFLENGDEASPILRDFFGEEAEADEAAE